MTYCGLGLVTPFLLGTLCGTAAEDGSNAGGEWGRAIAGVQCAIDIEMDDSEVALSRDSIRVVMRTKNIGTQTVIVLTRAHVLNIHQFMITGPDGKRPPYSEGGFERWLLSYDAISLGRSPLEQAEEIVSEFELNDIYDMSQHGKYTMRFSRTVFPPTGPPQTATSNTFVLHINRKPIEAPKPESIVQ